MTLTPLPLTAPWPLPLRRLLILARQALQRGDHPSAITGFRAALAQEPNLPEAHLGQALASRPGPDYLTWLALLHQALKPRLYLEIGVETGRSLRLVAPGCRAIGVDPDPGCHTLPTGELIRQSSAAFFADPCTPARLAGSIDLTFIDGDHRFATVLADVLAAERFSHPGGIIAVHDTWPLDAVTATAERRTGFHSGDGWKLLPCLRLFRPDLRLLTIATAPTGLTLIGGLNPAAAIIDQTLARDVYHPLPYEALQADPAGMLSLQANDPTALPGWLDGLRGRAMATAK